jgi:hypothetical protein
MAEQKINHLLGNENAVRLMQMHIELSARKGELELFLYDYFSGKKEKILTADDEQRMDTYRALAKDLGYTLGEYVHKKRKGVVAAEIS